LVPPKAGKLRRIGPIRNECRSLLAGDFREADVLQYVGKVYVFDVFPEAENEPKNA
jgi:hypothetical protein